MKRTIFILIIGCLSVGSIFAQKQRAVEGNLIVYAEQGWILKAQNQADGYLDFKFKWTTIGTDGNHNVVSSSTEESNLTTLNPFESRQFFTAPQDPNRQITYVFDSIEITYYRYQSKVERLNEELRLKQEAKQKSGQ